MMQFYIWLAVSHFAQKARPRGVTEPNLGRGRAILVKNLDPLFRTCLKRGPIIPQT